MSWREELRAASFRGVPFEVVDSGLTGGRRGPVHEYPLRDNPYFEDMGLRARKFRVEGFVVGADYMRKRDALISALEQGEAGQLVHPFYGSRNVAVTEFRVSESSRSGGSAAFSIDFEETGNATQPAASDDPTVQVKSAADIFDLEAVTAFAERFLTAQLPDFATAASITVAVDAARSMVAAVTDSAFADRLSAFIDDIPLLVGVPSVFGAEFASLTRLFPSRSAAPGPTLAAMAATDEVSSGALDADIPRETPNRKQEAVNAAAMSGFVRRLALSSTARNLADTAFVSANDANAAMVDFADRMDAETERDNVSDREYTAARALTAKVVADLSARLGGLPRVRRLRISQPRPAVTLAYDLYEDPLRDAEIIARNAIQRPGFVPAGEDIEVLSE